jgi:hypothetical protein
MDIREDAGGRRRIQVSESSTAISALLQAGLDLLQAFFDQARVVFL